MSESISAAEVRVFTLFRARDNTVAEVEALCHVCVRTARAVKAIAGLH